MSKIKIHDVGMRDGLQNESKIVPTEIKIDWINKLIQSNVDIIQIGSFVHPVKVPQMADTDELFSYFSKIEHKPVLSGLLLNEKGMERAINCGVEMFCMGVSASDTHSKKNTGMDTIEAQKRIINIAKELIDSGKKVQVSVQSAFGCGFEGKISEEKVFDLVRSYVESGINNISLADTAGHAYPEQVKRIFSRIKSEYPQTILTCHFHNTYGLGLANCYVAINDGVEYFETAFGGLGGCPFTKVAAGNVCTEDLVHSINRNESIDNINIDKIIDVSKSAEQYFERKLEGYVYRAGKLSYN